MIFGINTTRDISKLSQITYNNFEISPEVFMPNITTNHAITYTNFDRRVRNLHSRVNKQLQVIKKFRKLITGQTRLKLYNAFITACFRYCSNM